MSQCDHWSEQKEYGDGLTTFFEKLHSVETGNWETGVTVKYRNVMLYTSWEKPPKPTQDRPLSGWNKS